MTKKSSGTCFTPCSRERVSTFCSRQRARRGSRLLETDEVDLVILDMMLPGMDGRETLRHVKEINPTVPVIVITAFSSIDGAIDAMKQGAFHYIPKPFKNEEVILTVNKALEQRRLSSENERLKAELEERYSFSNIIGKSDRCAACSS
jgi:DNA-binding NtrC family response regulator